MGTVRIVMFFLAAGGLAGSAWGQSSVLLLDRSGSMSPYYAAGVVDGLAQAIEEASSEGPPLEVAVFSTEARRVSSYGQVGSTPLGAETYLDHALQFALDNRYGLAWIVTDNVQDQAGAASAGNTRVFYEQLKRDAVRRVTIFPLLQPPGRGGLVVYALLLDADYRDTYEAQLERLQRQAQGQFRLEGLHMKPLDRDTVDIKVVQEGGGQGQGPSRYREGDVIRETISLRFVSKFEHLKIEDATIEVSRSQAEFGPESLLTAEKHEVTISPVTVKNLEPGGETEQVYQVTFDLGKVRLKKDLASLWEAAFGHARETQEFTLSFVINVPQRNFRFKAPFLSEYNAPTPAAAKATGRVYGIEELPVLVGEQATIILSERKFPVQIDYPFYPALIFAGLFLAGAALAAGVVYMAVAGGRRLLGRSDWQVAAFDEMEREVEAELDSEGEVRVRGERLGVVQRSRFEVAEGVQLLEPEGAEAVRLQEGLELKLKTPAKRSLRLVFQVGRAVSEEVGGGEPTRR